jgi:hypothetical protein
LRSECREVISYPETVVNHRKLSLPISGDMMLRNGGTGSR